MEPRALLFAAALMIAGCSDPDLRNEASLFLTRYEPYDPRGSIETRAELARQLRALPLTQTEVIRVRDACAEHIEQVVRADTLQAAATQTFLAGTQGGAQTISDDRAAELQVSFAEIEESLAIAARASEACARGTRNLEQRTRAERVEHR